MITRKEIAEKLATVSGTPAQKRSALRNWLQVRLSAEDSDKVLTDLDSYKNWKRDG